MSLWSELAFLVVETSAPLAEVAAALPVPATLVNTAPRSWALAKTIHHGQHYEANTTDFALFALEGKVVVAPPGGIFMRNGETHWPRALSARFGRVWGFTAADYAPSVIQFDGGEESTRSEPENETVVLAELARLLGTADLPQLLRSGDCVLGRAG